MDGCQPLWSDGAALPPAAFGKLKVDFLVPMSMTVLASTTFLLGSAAARAINCLRGRADEENLHDGITFAFAAVAFFGALCAFEWFIPSHGLRAILC
jgi:hypothetical protein